MMIKRNRRIKRSFLVCLFFILFFATLGLAQDIDFNTSVNRNKVALDETIELSLTVTGTQDVSPIKLPEIQGFQSKYVGPSTSISVVNGQYSSSISYKYILFPQQLGRFQIPGFGITIEEKQYSSKPIDLEIVESKSDSFSSQAANSDQEDLGDRIFLALEIKKEKAYLNERIPVSIKLFYSNIPVQDVQFPAIEQEGFVFEEFAKPQQYQDSINGISYNIIEFNVMAYPSRCGTLSLGPAELTCNLLYKSASRKDSLFDDFGVFSSSFFDNFLGSHEKRPITLKSKPIEIEILPLPDGAPENFSDGVGVFNFSVSASPQEVNVGDPVTIKMTISGDGNFKSLTMPSFKNSDNFKVYDPEIKQENKSKILEQVLIPKSEDIEEIPVISFSYFDVDQGKYKTITKGPFPLIVNKVKATQPLRLVELSGEQPTGVQDDRLGRDIVFIKEHPGAFFSLGWVLYRDIRLWIFVIGYALFVVGFCFIFRQQERMKTDTAYAKRLRAPRKAKKRLKQARQLIDQGKAQEFYDTVFKLLQQYFSHKLSIPEGMITDKEIDLFLSKEKIASDIVTKTRTLLAQCDAVRYGAISGDVENMEKNYEDLQSIIDFFERM
ncbi:MAG: BatD family protein [Candidatus Omnitrophica bacterium]|nr:BatD family protein [Candidatus Omnitrophota bacterium]